MTLAERVKAVRARARVRRWEYRQRNLAHGAWDRFRTALAHARAAYAIDEATAAALLAEGCLADDRGRGLEPPRTLIWISEERARTITGARPIALRLDAELLAARWLALVPFP
jgi:MoxR-like ATPase